MGERQKHALRMDQPTELVHVFHHVVRVNEQLVDDTGEPGQREIECNRRIRADHTLHRGMRNIALVPERYIFHGGQGEGADHARQAGQVFRQHRIALVRHGRRAFLAGREEFFRFQHFGALQMPDLGRQAFDAGCDDTEGGEIDGMTIARDHLRGDRLGGKAQGFGDMLFNAWIDVGECADSAGNGAGGDFLAGIDETFAAALEFSVGERHLDAKCCGLGVNTMAAANRDRVLVFVSPAFESGEQLVEIGQKQIRRASELDVETGVEHIG